jgi:hypothetical protein
MSKSKKPNDRVYAIALDDVLDERVVTIRRGAEYFDGLLDAVDGADVTLLQCPGRGEPVVMLPWAIWLRVLVGISGRKSLAPGEWRTKGAGA